MIASRDQEQDWAPTESGMGDLGQQHTLPSRTFRPCPGSCIDSWTSTAIECSCCRQAGHWHLCKTPEGHSVRHQLTIPAKAPGWWSRLETQGDLSPELMGSLNLNISKLICCIMTSFYLVALLQFFFWTNYVQCLVCLSGLYCVLFFFLSCIAHCWVPRSVLLWCPFSNPKISQ